MAKRMAGELYLPYDVPVVSQTVAEKGREMNPKAIKVGPYIVIRSVVNPAFPKYRMRIVTCRKCPSMQDPQKHWHKECTTLPGALTIAGNHLEACHSNGSSNEL